MINYLTHGTTVTFQTLFVDDTYSNEEWRPIKGYKNYMVSNLGRIKRLTHISHNRLLSELIFAPRKIKGGYIIVRLINNDIWKDFYVHRLVAEAFCNNPYNFNEVNHIDEDKTNNRADNLEWCNRYYNNNYGSRNKKASQALKKPVSQFTLDGEFIKRWDSAMDVEQEIGVNKQGIYNCCKGKQLTAGGFTWRYSLEKNVS